MYFTFPFSIYFAQLQGTKSAVKVPPHLQAEQQDYQTHNFYYSEVYMH